eukprot:s788_g4.t1
MRWDGDFVVGMGEEKPKTRKAKGKAAPKSESRGRRTTTERFTASCVSGVADTWAKQPKDVGGYSRFLPKANGEEPADLPQEVVDWLKRGYGKTAPSDSADDDSDDDDKTKKRRKGSEPRKAATKSKKKRHRDSSSEVVPASSKGGKHVTGSIPKKSKKEKEKEKEKESTTSADDDNDDNDDTQFPDSGYKLESMNNKKGDPVPCLYHPHLKTMIELDPSIVWKVKEDSEGISYVWDTNNKNKTRKQCSELVSQVLAPDVVTRRKGLGF